ncbi:hypothetical protein [Salinibacter sp. 10B]|uniref:hypothetical protein n=1 Tax=Salinibacter sp. 10B TaxID=1923971 RepID=UPI002342F9F6
MENLSVRQKAVRARLDWKYALGLALIDSGFERTVLCEFRRRLVRAGAGPFCWIDWKSEESKEWRQGRFIGKVGICKECSSRRFVSGLHDAAFYVATLRQGDSRETLRPQGLAERAQRKPRS